METDDFDDWILWKAWIEYRNIYRQRRDMMGSDIVAKKKNILQCLKKNILHKDWFINFIRLQWKYVGWLYSILYNKL